MQATRKLNFGVSPDYPNQRTNLLERDAVIRKCYEELANKTNWCVAYKKPIVFDNAQHGVIRVRNMMPTGKKDQFVEPATLLKNPEDPKHLEVAEAA